MPRIDLAGQRASVNPREGRVFVETVRVLFSDLIDAALTQTIAVGAILPADALVLSSFVEIEALMTDTETNITSVTVDVGVAANTDILIDALQLLSGTPTLGRHQHVRGDDTAQAALAGHQVNALFTAVGANFGDGTITALDTGIVEIHIAYVRLGNRGVIV